jgi:hypothetical protein
MIGEKYFFAEDSGDVIKHMITSIVQVLAYHVERSHCRSVLLHVLINGSFLVEVEEAVKRTPLVCLLAVSISKDLLIRVILSFRVFSQRFASALTI